MDGDLASLVVRAVLRDGLGAGAERRDERLHGEDEVQLAPVQRRVEPDGVVEHALLARDRGLLDEEERELHLDVRALGIQARLHRAKHVRDVLHVDDAAMLVQNLHEPAHVGPLELHGQVHKQADGRHGVLRRHVRLVPDLQGHAQAAHAHLVDPKAAYVRLVLLVAQWLHRGRDRTVRAPCFPAGGRWGGQC